MWKRTSSPNRSVDQRPGACAALIPFVIALGGILSLLALLWLGKHDRGVPAIGVGILGAVLVFDISVCVWVLVGWIRQGRPPELSFSPLIPSRAERDFRRQLRERPKRTDEEFYEVFFAQRSLPKEVPARLRKILAETFGMDLGALEPDDNLALADPEMDWADVYGAIEREFGVPLTEDLIENVDGTFDSLLDCVIQARWPDRSQGSRQGVPD